MKYSYPNYQTKPSFTPGTWGENQWKLGEIACTDRCFYMIPGGPEFAIFEFTERTHTGKKKVRWEQWWNGHFHNNYFTNFEDAVENVENCIAAFGLPGGRQKYRVYG